MAVSLFGEFCARNMPSEVTDCGKLRCVGSCAEVYSDAILAEFRTTNQKTTCALITGISITGTSLLGWGEVGVALHGL
jgi:hypothetical protein